MGTLLIMAMIAGVPFVSAFGPGGSVGLATGTDNQPAQRKIWIKRKPRAGRLVGHTPLYLLDVVVFLERDHRFVFARIFFVIPRIDEDAGVKFICQNSFPKLLSHRFTSAGSKAPF